MMLSRLTINADTKLCCLIGDPVIQSISPEIHNASFKDKRINFVYLSFRVEKDDLKRAITGLQTLGVRGINVTIPHKESVMELLDSIDKSASVIGAVNTIINENRKLMGFNTDIDGFIEPFRERRIELRNRKALITGSGGSARACISGLVKEGCKDILILTRNEVRGNKMVAHLKKNLKFTGEVLKLNEENLSKTLIAVDIIVNATPVGMYPNVGESPIPLRLLKKSHVICDIVYKPLRTKLIEYGEKSGCVTIPGYEMLVNQAAKSFELWTGQEAPRDIMMKVAKSKLRG